jgi:hypothetical protein
MPVSFVRRSSCPIGSFGRLSAQISQINRPSPNYVPIVNKVRILTSSLLKSVELAMGSA